jgi:MFS family permease
MSAPTSTSATSAAQGPTISTSGLRDLARIEVRRFATRPAFLIGAALTVLALAPYLDPSEPVDELSMIAPAATVGLVGMVVSARRVWDADRCAAAAGPTPRTERQRTLAHLVACLVPFAVGVVFVVVTLARYATEPPPPDRYTALVSDAWVASVFVALGAVSCLGGPLLGVVLARRTSWQPAAILAAVGAVAVVIVFQGLFEPLRRVRVLLPWTYWGGPFGTADDPERHLVLVGAPQWWLVYLLVLCAIGALVALRHDREQVRMSERRALVVLGALAVVAVLLAMWTGTPETLVNPIESSATSWGGGGG